MKKIAFLLLVFTIGNTKHTFSRQIEKGDSLGLPGDNLNLVAVLDVFQKSETFEIFEKNINQEDSKLNNLDLNNDGKTDYIKVIDHKTGDAHSVVLQVPINEKETQDVAVIEIEKDKTGKILVQIIGDEELYGKDYIIEPTENEPSSSFTNTEKKTNGTVPEAEKQTVVNHTTNNYYNSGNPNNVPDNYVVISNWPIIHHVYRPTYIVYVSPWYWYSYPIWWKPWTPWYWQNYYRHHHQHNYYGHYHRSHDYRAPIAHGYYGSRKSVSRTVQNNRSSNAYNHTYEPNGRGSNVKVKPEKPNPAFHSKPQNKPYINNHKDNGNNNLDRPKPKPHTTNSPAKFENKPSNTNNKPRPRPQQNSSNKPSSKPPQKQSGAEKQGKSAGGGRGR